jgi:hypothetical protein
MTRERRQCAESYIHSIKVFGTHPQTAGWCLARRRPGAPLEFETSMTWCELEERLALPPMSLKAEGEDTP